MHAHSQFCWAGDNTINATKHAISTIANEDADEAIVLILSDANLRRWIYFYIGENVVKAVEDQVLVE